MKRTPFFSMIVPAYNAEEHITKLLDSIRNQTFTDYELIVVCDSCVDNTAKIAKDYGARVFNVNYNLDGLTRNKGIDVAKGEWLLFADDDDWLLHEYVFQQLADMAGRHDEDALLFSYISKDSQYFKQLPETIQVPVWSKCWRKSFVGDTRFSIRHYWSDCDFHNKIMKKKHRFVYWDMPMYYYNFMRKGSISQKAYDKVQTNYGKPARVILNEDGYQFDDELRKKWL